MNKLMEYMALGKPTVVFDLIETRYSAQDAALYVPPNDVSEFARRVDWLLRNPSEAARIGEVGQCLVRRKLAWEYSEEQLLRSYRSVAAGEMLTDFKDETLQKQDGQERLSAEQVQD
jgi:glycosyltransferase involved in cell wall biosynthesis